MLYGVKARAQSYDTWAKRVAEALSADQKNKKGLDITVLCLIQTFVMTFFKLYLKRTFKTLKYKSCLKKLVNAKCFVVTCLLFSVS